MYYALVQENLLVGHFQEPISDPAITDTPDYPVETIQIPVFAIAGSNDVYCPAAPNLDIIARIPASDSILVEGFGHQE